MESLFTLSFPMSIEVNLVAVLVAAIANMIIGSIWYGPLFGKKWMALSGMTKESIEKCHPNMHAIYAMGFGVSLLMSYVLAHFVALNAVTLSMAFEAAFWTWLGFIATVSLNSVIWGGRSKNLWLLDNVYYLVSLLVMAGILFSWK